MMGLLAATFTVAAQDVIRSSSPRGMQVQGNTELRVSQDSAVAVSVGQANVARNTAAALREGVQIQGKTSIKVEQSNTKATAVGKNNAAGNEVGVIGGK